jgi:hypothetical protein
LITTAILGQEYRSFSSSVIYFWWIEMLSKYCYFTLFFWLNASLNLQAKYSSHITPYCIKCCAVFLNTQITQYCSISFL